jgi:hypothetical protein
MYSKIHLEKLRKPVNNPTRTVGFNVRIEPGTTRLIRSSSNHSATTFGYISFMIRSLLACIVLYPITFITIHRSTYINTVANFSVLFVFVLK